MYEQIGRAIIAGKISRVRAIPHPSDIRATRLQLGEIATLWPVANNEKMKILGPVPVQLGKSTEKQTGIFFLRQPAYVEQKSARRWQSLSMPPDMGHPTRSSRAVHAPEFAQSPAGLSERGNATFSK